MSLSTEIIGSFSSAQSLGDIKDALVAFFNFAWPTIAATTQFSIGTGNSALEPLYMNGTANGSYGNCGFTNGWSCASANLETVSGLSQAQALALNTDVYLQSCYGVNGPDSYLLGYVQALVPSLNMSARIHAQVLGVGGDFSIGATLNTSVVILTWKVPADFRGDGEWGIDFPNAQIGASTILSGVSGFNNVPSWANAVVAPVVNVILSMANGMITGAVNPVLGNLFQNLVKNNIPYLAPIAASPVECGVDTPPVCGLDPCTAINPESPTIEVLFFVLIISGVALLTLLTMYRLMRKLPFKTLPTF